MERDVPVFENGNAGDGASVRHRVDMEMLQVCTRIIGQTRQRCGRRFEVRQTSGAVEIDCHMSANRRRNQFRDVADQRRMRRLAGHLNIHNFCGTVRMRSMERGFTKFFRLGGA